MECKFQRTAKDSGILSHCTWLTYSSVILPIPISPATEPLSLGQLEKGGSNIHFQDIFESKRAFPRTYWQAIYIVFTIECASGMRLRNQILRPRTAEDEEQIDLEPEQLTLITQKTASNDTSSRRLGDTHKLPNRQYLPQRRRKDNSPVHVSWTETALFLYAENIQNQEFFRVLEYKQLSPIMSRSDLVTGIEVFKSARTLMDVQVSSQTPRK